MLMDPPKLQNLDVGPFKETTPAPIPTACGDCQDALAQKMFAILGSLRDLPQSTSFENVDMLFAQHNDAIKALRQELANAVKQQRSELNVAINALRSELRQQHANPSSSVGCNRLACYNAEASPGNPDLLVEARSTEERAVIKLVDALPSGDSNEKGTEGDTDQREEVPEEKVYDDIADGSRTAMPSPACELQAQERISSEVAELSEIAQPEKVLAQRSILINSFVEAGDDRSIEASVYEAVFIVFLPFVGFKASMWVLMVFIMNCLMQLLFVLTVSISFNLSRLEREPFRLWRLHEGHSVEYLDSAHQTLVSRVCEGYGQLSVAQGQSNIIRLINQYNEDFIVGLQAGPTMCALTLAIWFLLWNAEFFKAFDFCLSYFSIPHHFLSTEYSEDPEAGEIEIKTISTVRHSFMAIVTLLRMGIATALLIQGSLWLIFTVQIESVILNGVALAFICETDELLYTCFMPRRVKRDMEKIKPLRPPCLAKRSQVSLLMLIVYLVVVASAVISNSAHLNDIWDDVCKDNKHFAVYVHDDLGVTMSLQTPVEAFELQQRHEQAAEELIGWSDADTVVDSRLLTSFVKFVSYRTHSPSQIAQEELPGCLDMGPEDFPYFWKMMTRTLNNNATSCLDLNNHCGVADSPLVRMLCPVTCRCSMAYSNTAIRTGCPKTCHYLYDSLWHNKSIACVDQVPNNDTSAFVNVSWAGYWQSYIDVSVSNTLARQLGTVATLSPANAIRHKNFALEYGCEVVNEFSLNQYICADSSLFQSIASYCPITCQCAGNDWWLCPRQCYL